MINNFNIIHQNIRSLRQNFDLFTAELENNNILADIVILSEIWIKSVEVDFYNIPNFKLYANCNDNYRAGGIAVFVKDSIQIIENVKLNLRTADILYISFMFSGKTFHLLAVYRLIFETITDFVSELQNYFSNVNSLALNKDNVFWIGDVNINILEHFNVGIDRYKAVMAANGFESLINVPTRITQQSESCIDHVHIRVARRDIIIVDASVDHVGITDHSLVKILVKVSNGSSESEGTGHPLPTHHFCIDKVLLKQLLDQTSWDDVYNQTDPSSAFDVFCKILHDTIRRSTVQVKQRDTIKKLKPWINESICSKIKRRNHLFKLVKKHPNNEKLKLYYLSFRNTLQDDIRNVKNNYYKRKFEKCKGNSKATWKVLSEVTGQTKKIENSFGLEIGNEVVVDPFTVANEFNNYFLNIVSELDLNCSVPSNFSSLNYNNYFPKRSEMNSIFLESIAPNELEEAIRSLKNNTSPGKDGISAALIKDISTNILDVLLFIVNQSFTSGVFPSKLKLAVVIPVFKNGSRFKCNSYRPISLLSCFSKIFEKLMKKKLLKFLERTHFFSNRQFGFRTGMNTENALLSFMTEVFDGLNEGKCVSGLFLDIRKAFDMVDHNILLNKLYNCGIRGVAYRWFESYLLERGQYVKINSVLSHMGTIKNGVPQGSVLGALLFIIYINDLCNARFSGNLTSFADDTAISYSEKSWDAIKVAMNKDLEALQWWFSKNKMLLSSEKTKYINFNLKRDVDFDGPIYYKCVECLCLGNPNNCVRKKCAIVERAKNLKYLGIIVDSEVSWKAHIGKLKDKINAVLRYFYFLKDFCPRETMRLLYFALVQSRLEYGIIIWGGAYETYMNLVYLQQKHVVRLISGKGKYEHSMPLFLAQKILPIKYIFVFKVLKMFYDRSGYLQNNLNDYKQKLRNTDHYIVPKPKNAFYTKTYNFLAPRIFNKLPDNIRNIGSKKTFVHKLRKWLFTIEEIGFLFQIQR